MALEGRTILITGAANGIGAAIADAAIRAGARVLAMDSDDAALQTQAASQPTHRWRALVGDVTEEADVVRAIETAATEFAGLDGVVCNAGIMHRETVEDLALSEWRRILDTNLTQGFLFAKHAAQPLRAGDGGALLMMSSTRAFMSEADTEAYSATKGGLFALTHALSISLGPAIRVNAIAPGWIDTADDPLRPVDHDQHPVGRVGRPEDIAHAALFLLNPVTGGFITGETLVIDGGMTRKMIYEH